MTDCDILVDGRPSRVDLAITKGAPFTLTIQFLDPAGAAVDVSAHTFTASPADFDVDATLAVVGQVILTLTEGETGAYALGRQGWWLKADLTYWLTGALYTYDPSVGRSTGNDIEVTLTMDLSATIVPGAAGVPGPEGPQGEDGPQGDAATLDVGTTTTGMPGTPAEVTNVGDTSDAIFNFQIPEGVAGADGSDGATGTPGNDGADGADGAEGDTGPAGEAAQIAGQFGISKVPGDLPSNGIIPVDWDAVGKPATELDFNVTPELSLVYQSTPDGEPLDGHLYTYYPPGDVWNDIGLIVGPAGTDGTDGADGADGDPGLPGADGADGDDGLAATATAGDTTTLAPGVPASVTNVGTVNAAIFDFGVPEGLKGDAGDPGVTPGFVVLTQAEYDALGIWDPGTQYWIVG